MLEELHVRDLALIEDAWVELGPGLNVLTGETGAGKTVLVGALQLLVGERADSGKVRSGAAEALVEGRFLADGGEMLARRRVSAEGRSRCYLDDGLATVGELGERLGPLVELHGQHDHQRLLRSSSHAGFLDRYAGPPAEEARSGYRAAFSETEAVRKALADLRARLEQREQRADYLRFQLKEIEAVSPQEGEDEELRESLPRLRHGERLKEAADTARDALRDEGGAQDGLAEAVAVLEHVGGVDTELDALAEETRAALATVDDLGMRLRAYADGIEHEPEELERVESRLASLERLVRKYGPTFATVLETARSAEAELEELDEGEAAIERAEEEVARVEARLREAGERLAGVRREAASRFVDDLSASARSLAMEGARFDVSLRERPFDRWTNEGPQDVEFLYAPRGADEPRPLARIASGGEISRVMLAMKSVFGEADATPVLVFDEIDAGIGGAAGMAVGARLASLARGRQVLVVTHLAQVAAFADRHLVVSRHEDDGRVTTSVSVVERDARKAELARMLSGTDSETGLAHAEELLETARR